MLATQTLITPFSASLPLSRKKEIKGTGALGIRYDDDGPLPPLDQLHLLDGGEDPKVEPGSPERTLKNIADARSLFSRIPCSSAFS